MKIAHHTGPLTTAGLMVAGILIIDRLFIPGLMLSMVAYLFSGEIFSDTRITTGGALDQNSLQKGYFIFCLYSALIIPFVAVVHWFCDWELKLVRVIFKILSATLFFTPFSILTITFYQLLRYIGAMGFTPMRLIGMVCSLVAYVVIFGFLYWTWRLKTPKHDAHKQNMA